MPKFSADASRRIVLATRHIEDQPRNKVPRRSPPIRTVFAKVFLVTTQIRAASAANVPGSGQGTMCKFDLASGQLQPIGPTGITIYNITLAKIIVGSYVMCISMDGQWFYDVTDCANGA